MLIDHIVNWVPYEGETTKKIVTLNYVDFPFIGTARTF